MDRHRIPTVTQSLSSLPSRRDVLRGLVGAGLGVGAARLSGAVVAKRRGKPQKARPNEFGCLNAGDPCKRAGQCCSGVCEGKKGKRRCKAHDTGGCAAGVQPEGCGTDVACTTSSGKPGHCVTTTGNAGYCAATIGGGGSGYGQGCKTDVECQVVAGGLLGPTAACVRCDVAVGGTVCAAAELETM